MKITARRGVVLIYSRLPPNPQTSASPPLPLITWSLDSNLGDANEIPLYLTAQCIKQN